jgi:uncharacterized protein YecT (DUF1311 family)
MKVKRMRQCRNPTLALALGLLVSCSVQESGDSVAAQADQRLAGTKAKQPAVSVSARQKNIGYRRSFDECMDSSNGVTVSMLDCASTEFDYQDDRLNAAYKHLHQVLPKEQWESLKGEQRRWLAENDKACAANEDLKGGTAETVNVTGCLLGRWVERADVLDALLERQVH